MTTRLRLNFGALLFAGLVACSSGNNNNTATCGDGVVGGTEQCDDGNTTNGDGCSASCTTETTGAKCGDGVVNGTEQCDDGNTTSGDGCSATCTTETSSKCGNGALDAGETCDDGNTAANDGCSAACAVESGYVCTGTPSVCAMPAGTCAAPFVVTLADNGGTLMGTGTGDTTSSTDQVTGAECDGLADDGLANDHIWQFTIADTRDVTITIEATTTFDSVLRLFSTPCDHATEINEYNGVDGCSDGGVELQSEVLAYSALPAGTYYVVIDGYNAAAVGTYSFNVAAAPTTCGDGKVDPLEICDDGNTTAADGCSASCDVEAGYVCTGTMPSVCTVSCGNGTLDPGEECEDGNTTNGDRCSSTCTLEYDVLEAEPNDTTAQTITAANHIIKGALTSGDVDLYTFTLTVPSIVQLETYDTMNNDYTDYGGVGSLTNVDCLSGMDTEVRVFGAAGNVTMNATALFFDDDEGDGLCSYLGPNDTAADGGSANPLEGVLAAGTYTIKVNHYTTGSAPLYILDLKITPSAPVAPAAGDLALNEFMAADNTSDTNCDTSTTNADDEFVELVNVSNKVLDLTGVTISDSVAVRHTFATGTSGSMILGPGKAMTVWGGGAPACAGVTNWFVASTGQLALTDTGDTITVKNAAATTIVSYAYPAQTLNKSSNLSPDVTGTAYVLHDTLPAAVGAFSPGRRANGHAF